MPAKKSPFGVHPSVAYVARVIENLPATTGRSLDAWVKLIERDGPAEEKERRSWLRASHGLGNTTASLLAEASVGKLDDLRGPEAYLRAAEGYVESMFAGPKAGLRPLCDAILKLAHRLGKDVKACPCKTIIPLYRQHVFAQIKPDNRTRIDLGFALGDTAAQGRLQSTGGHAKGDRITHRIGISSLADIDDQVRGWLQAAYDRDE